MRIAGRRVTAGQIRRAADRTWGAVHAADPLADESIRAAIAAGADEMTDLLARLIAKPTTLGHEEAGQRIMADAFRALGLRPLNVPMNAAVLWADQTHSPFDWDVAGKQNVVASWGPFRPIAAAHRSLVLNGHIDVVPPDAPERWTRPPFEPFRDGDWMVGRGAADMKSGLAAMVGAIAGLRRLGLEPLAPVTLQSVVEEECTGNGTLACLLAGAPPNADGAIVLEPFGAAITTSQVGVIWFDVRISGSPGHAGDGSETANPIEAMATIIRALRTLESELNAEIPDRYAVYDRPIQLNIGAIRGGSWASTSPGQCTASFRLATFPGHPIADLRTRVERTVADAAAADPALAGNPPEVRYAGFAAEGYEVADDAPLVEALARAYARVTDDPPARIATTGTSDARHFGFRGIPAVCFGPYAEGAHGIDERVWLPSVVTAAQTIGLFIRDWCGLGPPAEL